jgi:Winged helix DNA-binding domain
MVPTHVALERLAEQRLTQNPLATPEEVVAWLGAVQAQDYQGAKWALYQRMRDATNSAIERAVTNGSILRTHIMRPTWHFVTPADIRWMQALTAPRIIAGSTRMYRLHELDDSLFERSNEIIAGTLRGGRYLTRAELGSALAEADIVAAGLRLSLIVHRAELDAVVCSGPLRGKQFTYALLDERAPNSRSLPRDEALAELVRRYYTSHGPATVHDFVWWSGLTVADGRAGIEMAGAHLTHEVIDGRTYWMSTSMPPAAEPHQMALLLPTYDEFLVGYSGFDVSRRAGRPYTGESGTFDSTLVIGGRVVGSWKRAIQKRVVAVDVTPFTPLTAGEREAIEAAARRYGGFVGMPVLCTIA